MESSTAVTPMQTLFLCLNDDGSLSVDQPSINSLLIDHENATTTTQKTIHRLTEPINDEEIDVNITLTGCYLPDNAHPVGIHFPVDANGLGMLSRAEMSSRAQLQDPISMDHSYTSAEGPSNKMDGSHLTMSANIMIVRKVRRLVSVGSPSSSGQRQEPVSSPLLVQTGENVQTGDTPSRDEPRRISTDHSRQSSGAEFEEASISSAKRTVNAERLLTSRDVARPGAHHKSVAAGVSPETRRAPPTGHSSMTKLCCTHVCGRAAQRVDAAKEMECVLGGGHRLTDRGLTQLPAEPREAREDGPPEVEEVACAEAMEAELEYPEIQLLESSEVEPPESEAGTVQDKRIMREDNKRSMDHAKQSIHPAKRSVDPAKQSIHPAKRSVDPLNQSINLAKNSFDPTPTMLTVNVVSKRPAYWERFVGTDDSLERNAMAERLQKDLERTAEAERLGKECGGRKTAERLGKECGGKKTWKRLGKECGSKKNSERLGKECGGRKTAERLGKECGGRKTSKRVGNSRFGKEYADCNDRNNTSGSAADPSSSVTSLPISGCSTSR